MEEHEKPAVGVKKHVAEVIVDLHVPEVDRIFHYEIPPGMAARLDVGHRVVVPFGRRRRVEGYVVGFAAESDQTQLRPITDVLDSEPLLTPAIIEVARWMSDYYLCPLVQALQCFVRPGSLMRASRGARTLQDVVIGVADPAQAQAYLERCEVRAPKQAAIIRVLLTVDGPLPRARLLRQSHAPHSSLQSLLDRGIVTAGTRSRRRNPWDEDPEKKTPHILTEDQQQAYDYIVAAVDRNEPTTMLLQGVTGSGKTEVYIRSIEHTLTRGRGAIVLVPEISLTPQTAGSFRSAFGTEVALLHSRMSVGERHDEWQRIFDGEARVVVGARSAVFAPVDRLGLIVIDEEHEASYKQEESPRYQARSVAEKRAQVEGAAVLLGSATPDLRSMYEAKKKGTVMVLPGRVHQRPLPVCTIVDMREELLAGHRSIFSRALIDRLARVFDQKQQALLFMNRRGYASFLLCRECGIVPRCDQCEVSLTLHWPDMMRCHYCEKEMPLPSSCPQCTSPYLRPFGGGTQKIQEELHRLFPTVRSVRMDADTTGRKGAHSRIVAAFAGKEYDCLVGTQMIAKGLHFPGVTLVGVVSADTSLFLPDYRAAERTFQLLTQVAGRAGRGSDEGHVIIQTYAPDHYAVQSAAQQDYGQFYNRESLYRQRAGYPPFAWLVRCVWSSESEEELLTTVAQWGDFARGEGHVDGVDVLGPAPAPISRLKGRYRYHMLFRGDGRTVRQAARRLKHAYEERGSTAVRLAVDIDPLNFM